MEGADGAGPQVCRDCKRVRKSLDRCGKCAEPELFADNLDAANLYLETRTQWQRNPNSGARTALRYDGLEAAARLSGRNIDPDLFRQMQQIEMEILGIDAERTRRAYEARKHR